MQQQMALPHSARAQTMETTPSHQVNGQVSPKQQTAAPTRSQTFTPPTIDEILIEGEARTANSLETISRFQPFQNLLMTPIKIKYGKTLQSEITIHLELVCCYSSAIRDLFVAAEELHRAYAAGASIRKDIKAILPPSTPSNAFQPEKAMNLIKRCLKHYPLLEYQVAIRTGLEQTTDRYFQNRELWKGPTQTPAQLKKKVVDYDISDVLTRLQCLTSEAVYLVTESLHRRLCEIKKIEVRSGRTDKRKAAAQRILYLSPFNGDAIGAFVGWVYQQEKLSFNSAKSLCELYTMADMLDVKDLAATCLNKLASTTHDAISQARENGIGIRALLQKAQLPEAGVKEGVVDPLADIVPVVFQYVQKANPTPPVLEDLVVNAIADNQDRDIITFLEPTLDHSMAIKLCHAFNTRLCNLDSSALMVKNEE